MAPPDPAAIPAANANSVRPIYAITIARHNSARDEVATELAEESRNARKYGVHQLWLVMPLVMPMLAVAQELRESRRTLVAK